MSNDQNELDETEPRAEDLSDDLARKYDPERLLKIISKRAGRGESLDASLRAKYEKRFGVDLSHVRVYSGEFAEEFNKKRGAHAVTIGSTGMILMAGSAEKSMASSSGQALLAHELTHVAQARRGLSFDTNNGPFATESGEGHEKEAEQVEQSVLHGKESQKGPSPQEVREAMERTIDEVKKRVMQMVADVMRNSMHRGGNTRRA